MTENKKKTGLKGRLTDLAKRSKKMAVVGAAVATMAVGGKANAAVGSPMRHGHYDPIVVAPPLAPSVPVVTPTPSAPVRYPSSARPSGRPVRTARCSPARAHHHGHRPVVHGHTPHHSRPMFGVGSRGGMHAHRGHMHHTLRGHSFGGGHFPAPRLHRGASYRGGMARPQPSRGHRGGFGPHGGRRGGRR